jgi:prolyl-tRNA editing enzyme YbaK/EbsC (Cys-tRNA(Pro) deacylase)
VTEHPAIAKFTAALLEAGMTDAAAGIRILTDEARTAALAAEALEVPVGAIANSLIFRATYGAEVAPLLVLTSGAHRADTNRLRALTGAGRIDKAGHPRPIRTLVDNHLAAYPVVWAAAGHPKSIFPTTFAQLTELTGGTAADVRREEDDS